MSPIWMKIWEIAVHTNVSNTYFLVLTRLIIDFQSFDKVRKKLKGARVKIAISFERIVKLRRMMPF